MSSFPICFLVKHIFLLPQMTTIWGVKLNHNVGFLVELQDEFRLGDKSKKTSYLVHYDSHITL